MATFFTVDDFETGSLDVNYQGDTGSFPIAGSIDENLAIAGSYSLTPQGANVSIFRIDDTAQIQRRDDGDAIRFLAHNVTAANNTDGRFLFGVQNGSTFYEYKIYAFKDSDWEFYLNKYNNGSVTQIGAFTGSTTYREEFFNTLSTSIEWTTAGSIITKTFVDYEFTVGSIVGSIVAVDTTFVSGGYGFKNVAAYEKMAMWDNIQIYGDGGVIPGSIFSENLSDTLSYSDALLKTSIFHISTSETFSYSDDVSSQIGFNRTLSDTELATDALSSFTVYKRTASDTQTTSDNLSNNSVYNRSLSDTQDITDNLILSTILSFSEVLDVDDSVVSQAIYNRAVSDTQTIADDILASTGFGISLSDTQSLSDSLVSAASLTRLLTDIQNLSDNLSTKVEYSVLLDDLQSLTDTLAHKVEFNKTIDDNILMTEDLAVTFNDTFDLLARLITLTNSNTKKIFKADNNDFTFKGDNNFVFKATHNSYTLDTPNKLTLREV